VRADREKEKSHGKRGEKLGRGCLLFSEAGDVYLYVDDGKVEQVRYE